MIKLSPFLAISLVVAIGQLNLLRAAGCERNPEEIWRDGKGSFQELRFLENRLLFRLRLTNRPDINDFGSSALELERAAANLQGSDLSETNLCNLDFRNVNLTNAKLIRTKLEGANFSGANLTGVIFEPTTLPDIRTIAQAKGLSELRFTQPAALFLLRDAFRNAGFRYQEKEITFALNRTQPSASFTDLLKYILFELTCEWGMNPTRPFLLFIVLTAALAPVYGYAIWRAEFMFKAWAPDRIRYGRMQQHNEDYQVLKTLPWRAVFWGFYFSLISAIHIGWRNLNIDNFLARIQFYEYTLRAIGWIRAISGLQSLVSFYFLALWALSYFFRPFP